MTIRAVIRASTLIPRHLCFEIALNVYLALDFFFSFAVDILPYSAMYVLQLHCGIYSLTLYFPCVRVHACAMTFPSPVLYETLSTHKIKLRTLVWVACHSFL